MNVWVSEWLLSERLPPLKICNFQEHQIKNLCYLNNTINIQGNKNKNNNNIINNNKNNNNNNKNNNNNNLKAVGCDLIVISLVYIFTRRAQFSTYLDVTDDVLVTNFPKCLQNNFLQIKNTNFCQAQL